MANYIKTLKQNSDTLYPVTTTGAIIGDFSADKIQDGTITPEKLAHDTYPAGVKTYWSSSQYTATSDTNLGNITITLPKAARVMFRIFGTLKTSRYTSHILLRVDGTEVTNGGTNSTSFVAVEATAIVNLSAGSHTVGLYLGGQDTGTTATLAAYCNNGFTWWCV